MNIMRMNGHEYVNLSDVVKAAGFPAPITGAEAASYGLTCIAISSGADHRPRYWAEAKHAEEWAKLVRAQRADGRRYGYGPKAPPPGESYSAKKAARKAARKVDVQRTVKEDVPQVTHYEEPAPPNALAVAQLAALQAQLDRIEKRLNLFDKRHEHMGEMQGIALAMCAAMVKEFGIKAPQTVEELFAKSKV